MGRRDLTVRTAKRKGLATGLAGGATVAALVLGWPWWLVVAGVGGTGYLGYKWLQYRGKYGLKF